MIHQLKNRNFYLLVLADSILFVASLFLAYAVRFAFSIPNSQCRYILMVLPWIISVKLVIFFLMGAYRGMWRYISLTDVQCLAKASFMASIVIVAGITVLNRFHGYPRSVFVADSVFTLFFCVSSRAAIRLAYAHYRHLLEPFESATSNTVPLHITRILIIGAGDAADKIIREVQGKARSSYEIVCCLDDDASKHYRSLLGIPVRGPVARLAHFAKHFNVREVLIAMPSVDGVRMREIVGLCEDAGLPFRTLPSLTSLIDGNVTINDLRPVNFEGASGFVGGLFSIQS